MAGRESGKLVGVWIVATVLGVVVLGVAVAALALVARLLPAGRGRDIAGFAPSCVVLVRRLRADRRLPRRARLALGFALAYAVSPVQLIPNFIPVIGYSDDLAVMTLALRYACRQLPRADVHAAWPGNPQHLDRLLGRPPASSRHSGKSQDRTLDPVPRSPSRSRLDQSS